MELTIEVTDEALEGLVDTLDQEVGEGEWLMVLTADHGQTPDEETTGAWPILLGKLGKDIAAHFGVDAGQLILADRPLSLWVDRDYMAEHGLTEEEISRFILGYTIAQNRDPTPPGYEDRADERLFSAAFSSRDLPAIWRCARRAAKADPEAD